MKWKNEREGVLDRLHTVEEHLSSIDATLEQMGEALNSLLDDTDETEELPTPDPPSARDEGIVLVWSALTGARSGTQLAIVNPGDPRYNGGPFVYQYKKETIGEGETAAAALDTYMAKGGKVSAVPAITDEDYAQAEFFCTPGNVSAPTSVRHANDGFWADYFRSGVTKQGGEKEGPFATGGEAVAALRAALGSNL